MDFLGVGLKVREICEEISVEMRQQRPLYNRKEVRVLVRRIYFFLRREFCTRNSLFVCAQFQRGEMYFRSTKQFNSIIFE